MTHTSADIVVLHTGGVTGADLAPLSTLGCRLLRRGVPEAVLQEAISPGGN